MPAATAWPGPRSCDVARWRRAPSRLRLRPTGLPRYACTYPAAILITPMFDDSPEKTFLGVLAMTVEVGRFVKFPGDENQFAVLVNNRAGKHKGVVLQHPLFDRLLASQPGLPDRFTKTPPRVERLPDTVERQTQYRDPLAADADGGDYARQWLACMEPVRVRNQDTGWIVIVQEAYETAIGATLDKLIHGLIRYGVIALGLIVLVMAGLWGIAKRLSMNQ